MTSHYCKRLCAGVAAVVVLAFPSAASAQSGDGVIFLGAAFYGAHSVLDMYGGVSTVSALRPDGSGRLSPVGGEFALQADVNRHFAIVTDFAWQGEKRVQGPPPQYTAHTEILAGPRFSWRSRNTVLFAHTLFGAIHVAPDKGFAMAYGAGIDRTIKDRVALRLIQVDWFPNNLGSAWDTKAIRVSSGVVIRSRRSPQ